MALNHFNQGRYQLTSLIHDRHFSSLDIYKTVADSYHLEIIRQEGSLAVLDENFANSSLDILPHQILTALKVKHEFNGRALLADEVGLGKTIEAGIIIKEYLSRGLAKRILILTPPNLMRQWQTELDNKCNEHFVIARDSYLDFNEQTQQYVKIRNFEFDGLDRHDKLICSIDTAKHEANQDTILGVEWDMVIIDEAHRLKDDSTVNYKKLGWPLSFKAKYLLLLTATPMHNSLKELHALIFLIKPYLIGLWPQFRKKYGINGDGIYESIQDRDKLQETLQGVLIRTRKEQVSAIVSSQRIVETLRIEATNTEKETYVKVQKAIRERWSAGRGPKATSLAFELISLSQLMCSSTRALTKGLRNRIKDGVSAYRSLELIASALHGDDAKFRKLLHVIRSHHGLQVLVFTKFLETQSYIVESLMREGFSVATYRGEGMTPVEKEHQEKNFRSGMSQIMVATEAGSHGKNFQFCNIVINYDLPWNPMEVEQRIGRVHRIGQKNDVYVYNLTLADTIEDMLLKDLSVPGVSIYDNPTPLGTLEERIRATMSKIEPYAKV